MLLLLTPRHILQCYDVHAHYLPKYAFKAFCIPARCSLFVASAIQRSVVSTLTLPV
jgi:hypothetical protein